MDKKSQTVYAAIDLKSFYASVECVERKLNPLLTNLVVADASRTEKTICLAVSPSLKKEGVPGRPRLFEVVQKVKAANARRLEEAIRQKKLQPDENGQYQLLSGSFDAEELKNDPALALDYMIAPPRMRTYMDYSTRIYQIYLKFVSAEDIFAYSIDEVFINLTPYLDYYHMTAHELTMAMIREVLFTTGITATGGIGPNLYLAKIAMDIVAKHIPADKDGVRIAELDERKYREQLWAHEPITDFWRVGPGIARRLASVGIETMGDIARCSIGAETDFHNEELLYKLLGINAELLIDHAWGWEPTTIDLVKTYEPENKSVSSGQVLHEPYEVEKAAIVVREMTDFLVLDLVEKGLVTNQMVLDIGYDRESLNRPEGKAYRGKIVRDGYGRRMPQPVHGSVNLNEFSSSNREITAAVLQLYQEIVHPDLLVRRITITASHVVAEAEAQQEEKAGEQLSMFVDYAALEKERAAREKAHVKERKLQQAVLGLHKKYGRNALLKGTNLQEGSNARERNEQVGGHKG